MKVRVFSTPVCPYCFALKEFLKDSKVEFEDVDVAGNDAARE
jgi:glutaredoxin